MLATFIILLLWMSVAKVDEVVTGSGKAIPTSGTQMVQAIDGGMVEEILVKESQTVSKDAVLVKINQTRSSSSLVERNAQLLALTAKASRLEAQTQGKPFIAPVAAASMSNIIEHERRLYQTSLEEMRSAVRVARDQAFQRRQELVEANARLSQLTGACKLAENELNATKQLLPSGAVSELEVIRLEKESARAKADRDQARAQITRTSGAIQEAEGQIK
ncbi:MAG: HlyD family secretion protein [Synergistaceae bacterium]|nr:HlyD family secretion protein [Synergistaceae bacterium]